MPQAKKAEAKAASYTIPAFEIGAAAPPPVKRVGRASPYAPPEMVPQMLEALRTARAEKDDESNARDSAWVSFFTEPLTSEQRARNALGQIRKAVAAYAKMEEKALAGRVWERGGGFYFALQFRPQG